MLSIAPCRRPSQARVRHRSIHLSRLVTPLFGHCQRPGSASADHSEPSGRCLVFRDSRSAQVSAQQRCLSLEQRGSAASKCGPSLAHCSAGARAHRRSRTVGAAGGVPAPRCPPPSRRAPSHLRTQAAECAGGSGAAPRQWPTSGQSPRDGPTAGVHMRTRVLCCHDFSKRFEACRTVF